MPGTSVDLPEPVGAFSNTRARTAEETAARKESAISKTGNDTPEGVNGNAASGKRKEAKMPYDAMVCAKGIYPTYGVLSDLTGCDFRHSLPALRFRFEIGDVGEGNSHWCGVAAFLDAAEVDDRAAVAGTQLIEGGIEAAEFILGLFH